MRLSFLLGVLWVLATNHVCASGSLVEEASEDGTIIFTYGDPGYFRIYDKRFEEGGTNLGEYDENLYSQMADALGRYKCTAFDLWGCREQYQKITPASFQQLLSVPTLQELILNSVQLTDEIAIFKLIENNTTLTRLDITAPIENIDVLGASLAHNSTLRIIGFRGKPGSWSRFFQSIGNNRSLGSLTLMGRVNPEDLVSLKDYLEQPNCPLTSVGWSGLMYSLGFEDLAITEDHLKAIGKFPQSSLREFSLRDIDVGVSYEPLKPFLTHNSILTTLSLCNTSLTLENLRVIGQSLAGNSILQSLDLSRNRELEDVSALELFLKDNTTLRRLNLMYTSLHSQGLYNLLTFMNGNTTLHHLNLEATKMFVGADGAIADAGIKKLEDWSLTNSQLHSLSISSNSYYSPIVNNYDDLVKAFIVAISDHPSLTKLTVGSDGNEISYLSEAFKYNTVLQELIWLGPDDLAPDLKERLSQNKKRHI